MSEKALDYVQNQLAQGPFRLRGYVQEDQRVYPQRFMYVKLESLTKKFLKGENRDDRWVIMPGLRGVGKTTLIAQLYTNLLPQIDQRRMLYISLDEVVNIVGESLINVLDAYEQVLGKSYERQDQPFFLFIDEVHYDRKWATALKSLYDRTKKVFIISSGSSAIALQSNPDVIRRTSIYKLFPAGFSEYLMIKENIFPTQGLKKAIKEAIFQSSSAEQTFHQLENVQSDVLQFWSKIDRLTIEDYMKKGTLPFTINLKEEARVYQTIDLLIDKVINDDIQSIHQFDLNTLKSIKKILFVLADTVGNVSLKTLSDLFQLSPNTIVAILEAIEKTELLIRVLPFGRTISKVKKPSKYLFMSSAIRSSLLSVSRDQAAFSERMGKFLEDIAALTFHRELVTSGLGEINYDSAENAADFILTINRKHMIAVEVGIGKKGLDQVVNTMERIPKISHGIVVSKSGLELFKDQNIIKIPIDYFLLF